MTTFFGSIKQVGGWKHCGLRFKFFALAFLLLLPVLSFTGCATNTTLAGGANLAKAGQSAATQMQQNVTLSANTILTLRKAVAFNDGYNGAVGNANSQQFLANVSGIQGNLKKYASWLQSLSSSYAALGDLANYDAAGNFNSSIASLAGDTTNLAAALGRPVAVPPDATAGVKVIGDLLIVSRQAHEIKQGSEHIESFLTNVISMLEAPATKQQLTTIQKEVSGQIDQAAQVLFDNGMSTYSTLLDDIGAPLNLKTTSNADEVVKANKQILAGLKNVANESFAEQISAQGDAYDQSLSALKALIPLHESLRNGAPLNLSSLTTIINQLQTTAAMFSAPTK